MRCYFLLVALVLTGCAAQPQKAAPAPSSVAAAPAVPAALQPSQVGIGKITLGMPLNEAMGFFNVPDRSGTDDKGAVYHAYQVSPSGGYVVLMTATFRPDSIFGIQIAGGSDVKMTPIMGVRLGDTADAVLTHVGQPTKKSSVEGMDRTLWSYDDRNYSFEMDSTGHLASILIYGYRGLMPALGWPSSWERYPPNSIAAVIENDKEGWSDPKNTYYIAAGGILLRPRVRFTGDVRATTPAARDMMEVFFKTTPGNLSADMYPQSIKVVEEGKEYWLPIQSSLLDDLQADFKRGDTTLDLFAIWLGAKGPTGETKVVIVNNYCLCSW